MKHQRVPSLSAALAIVIAVAAVPPSQAQNTAPRGRGGQARVIQPLPQPVPHPIPSSPILPMANPIQPMTNPVQPIVPSPHLPFAATQSVPLPIQPAPVVVFPGNFIVPTYPVLDPLPYWSRSYESPRRDRLDTDVLLPGAFEASPYVVSPYLTVPDSRYNQPQQDYLLTVPVSSPGTTAGSPFIYIQPPAPIVLVPGQNVVPPPIGATRSDVLRQLGNPIGSVNRPATETLFFEGGRSVDLQNGYVVETR